MAIFLKALATCFAVAVVLVPSVSHAQERQIAEPKSARAAADSFLRLAEPAIVKQLELTAEQQTKIAELRAVRAKALAEAAPADATRLAAQFEVQLNELLTPEQRTKLAGIPVAEPKLRFNFRFQRWTDVLEWFAEQAGLSLVLDAPPPGTFNYSDDRTYSVSEAIDLLNGVLITKGYTLIRRDRMLLVVNSSEGIPESLVPRVPLDELDKRGRFEFVSVLFQVGNREVADVVQEITPLLGPLGKSMPLPKTRQVLVTDTAGVMRAIDAVIKSMPEAKAPPAVEPERPTLVVYPIKSADPEAVVKVLESLMPSGRFVRDPKANQVSAYATPAQQEAVKRVLEQMQTAEGPADQQSRFEVYPLEEGDAKQSLATLQPLVPNARLTMDPVSKKLAAWGTPADHEIIKKAVAQLRTGAAADDRQVEVYRLTKVDPTAALTTLTNLLPRARIAVDAATRSLIVLASIADQKTAKATLEQLEPGKRDGITPELKFYAFPRTPPASLVTALTSLVPKAQVTIDKANNRLSVVATAADHAVVKETVEQFANASAGEEKRQLHLYPVSLAQRKRFQAMLTDLVTEFPNVKVLTDAEPGELAIWATAAEHQVIGEIVEKLKMQPPAEEAYSLIAYSIKSADPASVLSVLQSLYPTTKLVLDTKSRRLVAWTRPAEQQSIKSLIEQMDTDSPAESKNQLMVYPVFGADATAIITMLKNLVPDAVLTPDSKANTIVAWARKSDQAVIGPAIERMRPQADPSRRPHVVAYPVGSSDPSTVYPVIAALVPTARVVPNAKNGTIAVWATPEEHEMIKPAIDEIANKRSERGAAKVVAYPVSEPAVVYPLVSALVPTARVVPNVKNGTIAVWATPEEHDMIRPAIEELASKRGGAAKVVAYPVSEPAVVYPIISSLVPTARVVPNVKNGTIAVWATPEEHEMIKPAIEEISNKRGERGAAKVVAYPVNDPAIMYSLVASLVPTARVVPNVKGGTIAVWATPEEHDAIRAAIDEIATKAGDANAAKVVVYSLKSALAANLVSAVQTAVPDARVGMGSGPRKLVVFARPADHETIKKTIDSLDQDDDDQNGVVLRSHQVTSAEPTALFNTLSALFALRREVRLSLDVKNNKIVAMATPAQHETIDKVIAEVERGSSFDATTKMEVHPLRNADPDAVLQVLTNVVTKQYPRTQISVDAKSKQLIAVAMPQQQETIRTTIERLQATPRRFEVLQLEVLEPFAARMAIDKLFSEGPSGTKAANAPVIEADEPNQRLYVRATDEQLAQVRDLLVKMGEANLVATADGAPRGLRVLMYSGDTRAALAEIQRVWPKLSKAPLRVVGPQESLRKSPLQLPSNAPAPPRPSVEPRPAVPPKAEPENDQQTSLLRSRGWQFKMAAFAEPAAAEQVPPAEPPAKPATPAETSEQAPVEPPAIIVAPGDDRFTIVSDDPEAIAQFEALLRAMAPPSGSGGRDMIVHPLRSASAIAVAELLQKMFRRNAFDTSSSVVIEADQRLNAVIVYAGRNDRAAIERLLKVLDSDDVPESLIANRPQLIPVKNTSATRIEQVLKDVYKTQLSTGGTRTPVPVPSGSSREVAAVIQQINTANTGPLMTLGVDDTTNSIVIMAPGPLVREVTELVAELDENALNDTSRGVKIVKLKSTSALRVKEILDTIIKDAVRRRASSSSRP